MQYPTHLNDNDVVLLSQLCGAKVLPTHQRAYQTVAPTPQSCQGFGPEFWVYGGLSLGKLRLQSIPVRPKLWEFSVSPWQGSAAAIFRIIVFFLFFWHFEATWSYINGLFGPYFSAKGLVVSSCHMYLPTCCLTQSIGDHVQTMLQWHSICLEFHHNLAAIYPKYGGYTQMIIDHQWTMNEPAKCLTNHLTYFLTTNRIAIITNRKYN